jgi:hypothetical protein
LQNCKEFFIIIDKTSIKLQNFIKLLSSSELLIKNNFSKEDALKIIEDKINSFS